jgi:hypothetical protein
VPSLAKLAGCLYVLPSVIALGHRHRHLDTILVVNLLRGGTGLSWPLALLLAVRSAGDRRRAVG